MLTKIRENIFVGDKNVTEKEIKEAGVTVILIVAAIDCHVPDGPELFSVILNTKKVIKPHIKDIACHIPKYMTQNGEIVAIIDETGMHQAAYVAGRAICELENKSIYDIFVEMKESLGEKFDIGKAYL